jgi:hypothetical protein
MSGTLTSNSCGTAVGAVESFQNTASVVVDGSDMTLSVGDTVTAGDYEDDAFDVSGSSAVDLAAMTGLQGTACELVRTDRLEGKFDGFGADTFDAKLTVHYEPNDLALCTELLVNTWDAPFKAIPCDVDYDVSGKKQ